MKIICVRYIAFTQRGREKRTTNNMVLILESRCKGPFLCRSSGGCRKEEARSLELCVSFNVLTHCLLEGHPAHQNRATHPQRFCARTSRGRNQGELSDQGSPGKRL